MITPDQEREFYDRQYDAFLALPDHALRLDRAVLEKNLNNPAHPFYERRRLYRGTLEALLEDPLPGRRVLDYGCGPADFGIWMATEGAEVTLLDLSPKAVELGLRRAAASGVARRVKGVAADATRLDMFADQAFELVFACASLHHTLKYPNAVEELARIMKPGARLVLCETWGANPVLNAARRLRAAAAREPEEQGEDIILNPAELRRLDPHFTGIEIRPVNLLAMGKRLLRGRLDHPAARAAYRSLELADSLLLNLCPPLQRWCGEAVIVARRL